MDNKLISQNRKQGGEANVPYAVYFDKALQGKNGRNPNDPQEKAKMFAVKPDPQSKPQTAAYQRGAQEAGEGRQMKTNIGFENSFEAKITEKGKRKNSYDSSHGTPGRSTMKPTCGDESEFLNCRFREWDNNPSSTENYTHIFNKVREERVTGSPMVDAQSNYTVARKQKVYNQVESRCPLCKQRFASITKAKLDTGFDLRTVVIPIPECDQVYQPSEEVKSYLDPYENVICSECHNGSDDALM